MIMDGIEARKKKDVQDSLVTECMEHVQFAQTKCAMFNGREDFLQSIKEKLLAKKSKT